MFQIIFRRRTKNQDIIKENYLEIVKTKQEKVREVQGVPQLQTAALLRHQEEEETDKSKQAQIEQT